MFEESYSFVFVDLEQPLQTPSCFFPPNSFLTTIKYFEQTQTAPNYFSCYMTTFFFSIFLCLFHFHSDFCLLSGCHGISAMVVVLLLFVSLFLIHLHLQSIVRLRSPSVLNRTNVQQNSFGVTLAPDNFELLHMDEDRSICIHK